MPIQFKKSINPNLLALANTLKSAMTAPKLSYEDTVKQNAIRSYGTLSKMERHGKCLPILTS